MVQLLVTSGGQLDVLDKQGEPPMHVACRNEDLRVVQLLLRWGANPDIRNKYTHKSAGLSLTALHIACDGGHTAIAAELLEHGAHVDATWMRHEDVLDPKAKRGRCALSIVCENGDIELAQLLLRHGAGVGIVDRWRQAPLHHACRYGHEAIA